MASSAGGFSFSLDTFTINNSLRFFPLSSSAPFIFTEENQSDQHLANTVGFV